jgi:antitoxin (DNA-binding transcriptional repressor) of toxin-antitoxin stability system
MQVWHEARRRRTTMSKALTVTEAVRHFSDYVSRVAYRQESFLLYRGKKAVAELRPARKNVRLRDLSEILRTLPKLSPEEADSFLRDIEEARASLPKEALKDPWAS